jgi:hypothetical protein
MVAIGALFGMGREVVESEGTSVEGVFAWYKKKFFSLAGGGLFLFLVVVGPFLILLVIGAAIYGETFLTIAVISSGPANFANPVIFSLLLIWVAISTGLLSMLFPSLIDGYSVLESIKRSVSMSIKYFDRVFGVWIAFLVVLGILVTPMFLIPFALSLGDSLLLLSMGLLSIYLIPAALILIFLFIPALTIGVTRVYMILTADDEYEETLEDETGPSFIGGV